MIIKEADLRLTWGVIRDRLGFPSSDSKLDRVDGVTTIASTFLHCFVFITDSWKDDEGYDRFGFETSSMETSGMEDFLTALQLIIDHDGNLDSREIRFRIPTLKDEFGKPLWLILRVNLAFYCCYQYAQDRRWKKCVDFVYARQVKPRIRLVTFSDAYFLGHTFLEHLQSGLIDDGVLDFAAAANPNRQPWCPYQPTETECENYKASLADTLDRFIKLQRRIIDHINDVGIHSLGPLEKHHSRVGRKTVTFEYESSKWRVSGENLDSATSLLEYCRTEIRGNGD